jgi:uncharacterized membrane protein (UPF0136 family)
MRFAFAYDPCVIQATEIFYFILGPLTLIGGIMGYVRKKSLPSLVAGSICGLMLITAAFLIFYRQTSANFVMPGLILGLLANAALAGQFIPKVMINRAAPHVILMAVLSAVGMVLTLIAFTGK